MKAVTAIEASLESLAVKIAALIIVFGEHMLDAKWHFGCQELLREPLIVDKRLKKEALECFKLIQIYMGDRKVSYNYRAMSEDDIQINCAFELAIKGYDIPPLRNELFLQVCKQSIDNSKQLASLSSNHLFHLFSFPPTFHFDQVDIIWLLLFNLHLD